MEIKIKAKIVLKLSIKEYCFTAQAMPTGIPIREASTILYKASRNVVGKRENSSWKTGRPDT